MHRTNQPSFDTPPPRRPWAHPTAARFFILCATLLILLHTATGCCTAPNRSEQLRTELDTAIDRAAGYLESQQADNGAWPSQTYGLFRDGVALTPHVVRSLAIAEPHNNQMMHGLAFIYQQTEQTINDLGAFHIKPSVQGPIYFCADTRLALEAARQLGYENGMLNTGAIHILKRHQISDHRSDAFAQHGGWGYGVKPFRGLLTDVEWIESFDHGKAKDRIYPNLSANISSTVYALDALAPRPLDKPFRDTRFTWAPIRNPAIQFATRCQNFGTGDERFDDGGFFFNPADAARNKGGPAGTDKHGYARFHSSGSSTADGLRVLLLCRVPRDDPRFVASRDWLFKHFDSAHNPGTFNADREVLRDAYYFYYAASVADTFTLLGEGPEDWAAEIARALLDKQQPDGSFANPFTDGKEDDPLIATPFALRAMLACRDALGE